MISRRTSMRRVVPFHTARRPLGTSPDPAPDSVGGSVFGDLLLAALSVGMLGWIVLRG